MELYHVFNDLRKSQLECSLLRKENNRLTTRNEQLANGRMQSLIIQDDIVKKQIKQNENNTIGYMSIG